MYSWRWAVINFKYSMQLQLIGEAALRSTSLVSASLSLLYVRRVYIWNNFSRKAGMYNSSAGQIMLYELITQ